MKFTFYYYSLNRRHYFLLKLHVSKNLSLYNPNYVKHPKQTLIIHLKLIIIV